MPEEILATFSVRRLSIMNENGDIDESLMPDLGDSQIRRLHELTVLSRTFDERALSLQREGRIGTYPPILGQEAAQVGSAFALRPTDWVVPSFREMGVHLTLGYPIPLLFQYWGGDERGLQTPDHLNILPICVSVGTQIPHGMGIAMAARYRRDPVVVCTWFGDGATSKGDFHEGLNMAGTFRLPIVFICQNNQWAISVPLHQQTAAETIAQKAVAYGFDGMQVDGNDIFAVYRATREALDKARSGGGPTLIECLTYRLADHTTADDAARYRSPEEVELWRRRDPLLRLERYMARRGIWDEDTGRAVKERAVAMVDEAVRTMESSPPPPATDLFDYTAATLSTRQMRQREEF